MNFNKELYKNSEAKEFGEFENLELGGHEIVIVDAREYTSEFSGNTSLKVSVDIAGNDKQVGFFKKQYDEAVKNKKDGEEVKWPTGAVRYLSLKDEQLAYLKGFITALENSNKGFKFNPEGNWEQLKNLKLAGVFGLEQYENQDGEVKTAVKLQNFRSLDKLNEIKVPKVKMLDGSFVDYEEYKNKSVNQAKDTFGDSTIEIDDSMLPF
jgi:hypothetical protein